MYAEDYKVSDTTVAVDIQRHKRAARARHLRVLNAIVLLRSAGPAGLQTMRADAEPRPPCTGMRTVTCPGEHGQQAAPRPPGAAPSVLAAGPRAHDRT